MRLKFEDFAFIAILMFGVLVSAQMFGIPIIATKPVYVTQDTLDYNNLKVWADAQAYEKAVLKNENEGLKEDLKEYKDSTSIGRLLGDIITFVFGMTSGVFVYLYLQRRNERKEEKAEEEGKLLKARQDTMIDALVEVENAEKEHMMKIRKDRNLFRNKRVK